LAKGIPVAEEKPTQPVEKKEYTDCVIQIRMPPPHPKLTGDFKATDTMEDLYQFIKQNQKDNFAFQIVVPYPKRIFKIDNLATTLKEAELCPRGAVLVEKI